MDALLKLNESSRDHGLPTEDLGVIAVASSATVGRIDDKRELRALPPVKLAGKVEPVALYAIDPMP